MAHRVRTNWNKKEELVTKTASNNIYQALRGRKPIVNILTV